MAIYRNVQMSFWTDSKVVDDFTPEDKLFYLYLMTNPHTNLCGCYEISIKQMSNEVGYNKDSIEKLLFRFETMHNVIRYSKETKELLLLKWHKYNWTESSKFKKALENSISLVKDQDFKNYLNEIFMGNDTVSIRYLYGMHTTDTDTDTITDTVSVKKTHTKKHKYGEFQHVLLSEKDMQQLSSTYSEDIIERSIKILDEYIEMKGAKYKNHYLVMKKWVLERAQKEMQQSGEQYSSKTSQELDQYYNMIADWADESGY